MEAIQTAASNTYRVRVVLYSPIDVAPAAGPSSSPVRPLTKVESLPEAMQKRTTVVDCTQPGVA